MPGRYGTGRYGEPRMKDNVIDPKTGYPRPGGGPGGQQLNIRPKDRVAKVNLKGAEAVATPKKQGTTQPTINAASIAGPGPVSAASGASRAAPPAIQQSNPAYTQMASTPGPGSVAPATNIGGSLPTDAVLDRMSGFASRYDPTQINQIMDNPNIVLEDVLKSLGYSAGNTRMAEMGPYAENMLNLAGLLQMSGSLGGADQADETMLNTLAELMSNGMGAGGQSVEYKNALGMLMNPKGAVNEYLFGVPGDPSFGLSQQAAALAPMFQAAISGVNPFTQRAMGSAYRAAENSAQKALAHGQMQSDPRILNYLRSNLGGIIPGF